MKTYFEHNAGTPELDVLEWEDQEITVEERALTEDEITMIRKQVEEAWANLYPAKG